MRIIGNIVTNKIIQFDPKINTVGSINEIIDGLPTLIIGWGLSKELFPEDFDILNHELKPKFFWCYTFMEKRSAYEIDVENFIQYCYTNIISDLHYVFVDPILFKLSTLKKTIKKLQSINNPIPYLHKDFIYIYGDNIIFGIDLGLCDYFLGISKEKVKNKIKSLSNGLLLDDTILIEYKDYLARIDSPKFIPYLYYIEHE
jgi:hypothetical protein